MHPVHRVHVASMQAMAVRGREEDAPVASAGEARAARRFSCPLAELPEEGGMAQLAAGCRRAGADELFLAALKIAK